jgi:dihydrofolate reductase
MRKLIASEWMSLDGVFDADTMEQWFHPYQSPDTQGYIQANVQDFDDVLVGRVTYEMLAGYWPQQRNNESGIADKLNAMPKHVVSTTLRKAEWSNSTIIRDNVVDAVTRLKAQPGRDIILFGSAALAQTLMRAGLIDEYRFLVHPVMAGHGKRFFRDGMESTLKLVESQTLAQGVLLLRYQPGKA